jgi:hypothetical protein
MQTLRPRVPGRRIREGEVLFELKEPRGYYVNSLSTENNRPSIKNTFPWNILSD